jgi:uncharacterized protein (TIGR02996 family)
VHYDDDAAFQRAILANPADTTLKFVYADWRQERDDLRAEFVRLQVRAPSGRASHGENHHRGDRGGRVVLAERRSARCRLSRVHAEVVRQSADTPAPASATRPAATSADTAGRTDCAGDDAHRV